MYMPRGGLRFERSAAAAAAAALCAERFEGVKLSGPEMGRRLPVRLAKVVILGNPKGNRRAGGRVWQGAHKQTNEGDRLNVYVWASVWEVVCVCVCVVCVWQVTTYLVI